MALGLAPNCHRPFATSPSLSLSTHGNNSATTSFTTPHSTQYRYIHDRFITHNEHFLTHPAIQTLIHQSTKTSSVTPLSLKPSKTSTFQASTLTSPTEQLSTSNPASLGKSETPHPQAANAWLCTGLASRLHTIYNYTYPSTASTPAADHLIHLYIAKRHPAAECKRLLKGYKIRPAASESAFWCACHPQSPGVHSMIARGRSGPFLDASQRS